MGVQNKYSPYTKIEYLVHWMPKLFLQITVMMTIFKMYKQHVYCGKTKA